MTATGAWFTDSDKADGTSVNFGTLYLKDGSVSIARAESEAGNIMPGDTLNVVAKYAIDGTEATTSGAWVRFKLTSKLGSNDLSMTVDGLTADEDGYYYVENAVKTNTDQTISISVTFAGATYGNDYQGSTVSYSIDIEIIQAKNNGTSAKAAFADKTISAYTPTGE